MRMIIIYLPENKILTGNGLQINICNYIMVKQGSKKLIRRTKDDIIYEFVYFTTYLKLCIKKNIYQFGQNCIYQIPMLGSFIIKNLHLEDYIFVSLQLYIRVLYFTMQIVYLEGCTLGYLRSYTLNCLLLLLELRFKVSKFIKNKTYQVTFLEYFTIRYISGCLIFYILFVLKKAMQKGCAADVSKATEQFLFLSQGWL